MSDSNVNELRRFIETIEGSHNHVLYVSSMVNSVTKIVKTACELNENIFFTPYISKFYDGVHFEKSIKDAAKKAVENESKKVIVYVLDEQT